jgi:hypothetical protein
MARVALVAFVIAAVAVAVGATTPREDGLLVKAHVASHANETFRNASGYLQFPYLVPAGPYTEAWDWDSM